MKHTLHFHLLDSPHPNGHMGPCLTFHVNDTHKAPLAVPPVHWVVLHSEVPRLHIRLGRAAGCRCPPWTAVDGLGMALRDDLRTTLKQWKGFSEKNMTKSSQKF